MCLQRAFCLKRCERELFALAGIVNTRTNTWSGRGIVEAFLSGHGLFPRSREFIPFVVFGEVLTVRRWLGGVTTSVRRWKTFGILCWKSCRKKIELAGQDQNFWKVSVWDNARITIEQQKRKLRDREITYFTSRIFVSIEDFSTTRLILNFTSS